MQAESFESGVFQVAIHASYRISRVDNPGIQVVYLLCQRAILCLEILDLFLQHRFFILDLLFRSDIVGNIVLQDEGDLFPDHAVALTLLAGFCSDNVIIILNLSVDL